MFDATPLGRLAHPNPNPKDVARFDLLLKSGNRLLLPEIADYEVRRSLLLHGLKPSIRRLDVLKQRLAYIPLNTETMLRAAEIWADTRRIGRPTAAPNRLDADAILMAQALEHAATVVTENIAHLSRFVRVQRWQDFPEA